MSSSKPGSPAKSPQKKKKDVTRYGVVSQNQPAFAKEERFSWQKPAFTSDTVYDLKPIRPNTGIVFGTANRKPLNEAGNKSSTGKNVLGNFTVRPIVIQFFTFSFRPG